ncbi:hypothetical protein O181_084977 [Austropuccinia psidii MF-1]|uniref:Uncharacterized protein n=1 Tax=Austropuccinia psidii MF-1 TaxID=1389203 RepID=A0A9Q3ILC5_9BASI|nr:hypothetical protein [Austropuccinia psidii MF-1]
MPVKHSPPAKNTRYQRRQAVLTPTIKAPFDHPLSVHQLSANLNKGPPMERAAPSRKGGVKSRRSRSFSGLLGGYPSISQGPRTHSNPPLVSQAKPNLLKMMEQMTQAFSPRDNSKAPTINNSSVKAPDSLYGTQYHKLRGFIKYFQLIFHNHPANFISDRKKVLN